MKSFYDLIILSPHLDDGVLSCGGLIFMSTAAGKSVLIATVMAGDPSGPKPSAYAQSLHDRWQLPRETAAARRAEDQRACHSLGADFVHWPFPDCIYRHHAQTDEPLYQSDEEIFGPINEGEWDLVKVIAENIANLPEYGMLYVPLTAGNHVDHQLTRLAAETTAGQSSLRYYEDYPYVRTPGILDLVLKERSWQSQTLKLTPEAVARKIEAISLYVSQLNTFFHDHDDLDGQVRRYIEETGGERFWCISC